MYRPAKPAPTTTTSKLSAPASRRDGDGDGDGVADMNQRSSKCCSCRQHLLRAVKAQEAIARGRVANFAARNGAARRSVCTQVFRPVKPAWRRYRRCASVEPVARLSDSDTRDAMSA